MHINLPDHLRAPGLDKPNASFVAFFWPTMVALGIATLIGGASYWNVFNLPEETASTVRYWGLGAALVILIGVPIIGTAVYFGWKIGHAKAALIAESFYLEHYGEVVELQYCHPKRTWFVKGLCPLPGGFLFIVRDDSARRATRSIFVTHDEIDGDSPVEAGAEVLSFSTAVKTGTAAFLQAKMTFVTS